MKAGANVAVRSKHGDTALDMAKRKDVRVMLQLVSDVVNHLLGSANKALAAMQEDESA